MSRFNYNQAITNRSLYELGIRLRANKSPHAHYLPLYEKYTNSIRSKVKAVMELGVNDGNSLMMWMQWFPNIKRVVGVDNIELDLPNLKSDNRYKILKLDQTDHLLTLQGTFDLIVDDAGHDPIKQKESLELLWPYLNHNGIYCIEDLESSFYTDIFPNAYLNTNSILPYLKSLCDDLHSSYGIIGKSKESKVTNGCFPKLDNLSAIHFHPNIVFLEKS